MRKIKGAVLVGTMVMAVSLGTTHLMADESPRNAYLQFWASVKAGELTQAHEYLFPIDDKDFLEQQKSRLDGSSKKLRSGALSIAVIDDKVQGDWAFLVVKISVTHAGETDESIQYEIMTRDRSWWKHVFKERAGDPSLQAFSAEDFVTSEKWWRANRDRYRREK